MTFTAKEAGEAFLRAGFRDVQTWDDEQPQVVALGPIGSGLGWINWRIPEEHPALCFAMLDVLRSALAYWEAQPFRADEVPNRALAKWALKGYLQRPWQELTTAAVAEAVIEAGAAGLIKETQGEADARS